MVPTLSPATQPKRSRSISNDDEPDVTDSWGSERKRCKPIPEGDYESQEKLVAECLILLSVSRGGLCVSLSSSSVDATQKENNSTAGAILDDEKRQETLSSADPTSSLSPVDAKKRQETPSSANTTSSSTVDAKKHQESAPATSIRAGVDANNQELDPATRPHVNNSYKCNVCGMAFASFRALGGHKTCHRPRTKASANPDVSPSRKRHECSVCHNVFQTGVALGGHKRKHYEGKISRSSAAKKDETGDLKDGPAAAIPVTEQVPNITTNSEQVDEGRVALILFGKKIYTDRN